MVFNEPKAIKIRICFIILFIFYHKNLSFSNSLRQCIFNVCLTKCIFYLDGTAKMGSKHMVSKSHFHNMCACWANIFTLSMIQFENHILLGIPNTSLCDLVEMVSQMLILKAKICRSKRM